MKKGETPKDTPAEPTEPVAEATPPAPETPAEGTPINEVSSGPAEPTAPEVPLMSQHDFFKSMATPTQNAAAGKTANSEEAAEGSPTAEGTTPTTEIPNTGTPPTGGGAPSGGLGPAASKGSAKAVVGIFDFAWALCIGMFLVNLKNQTAKYRATDSEKNELIDALADAMHDSGFVVSPWFRVFLTAVAIYGFKGKEAYDDNDRIEQANLRVIRSGNQPAVTQPQSSEAKVVQFTPPAQQPIVSPLPVPGAQTYSKCPTCNSTVADGKIYCDLRCAKRWQSDMQRKAAGKPMQYVGLSKADADKLAPKKAPAKKTNKSK